MKTLLIMRHAKSSWPHKVEEDRDRPLSKRGRKNAEQIGDRLKEEKIVPEVLLVSNAARAKETADLVMEAMHYQGDVYYLNSLYMAEVEGDLKAIQRLPDEVNCAMIIGHNPGLESLLQMMTGKVESLPTAAVAILRLPSAAWEDITLQTQAELVHMWKPKELE